MGVHPALVPSDIADFSTRFRSPSEELLGPLEDDAPKIMQWFSLQLMEALIDLQREGKQTGFRIPEALLRGWSFQN